MPLKVLEFNFSIAVATLLMLISNFYVQNCGFSCNSQMSMQLAEIIIFWTFDLSDLITFGFIVMSINWLIRCIL